jgi:glycine/D-amino acid oxidase-like deaminating enzyme
MRTADVLIIGAGVMGASVAYHLAVRGCQNIVVLEQNSKPGEGSTLKATGGFRCQFGSEINVRISLLSREKLRRFPEELGVDSGYRTYGYLFLAMQDSTLKELYASQQIQIAAGLTEVQRLDSREALQLNPAINPGQICGGVYCGTDGFIRANQILNGYIGQASHLGVQFEYGKRILGFRANGRIQSVGTTDGEIHAGIVINAAGAWAAQVGQLAGCSIPVKPVRRQVAVAQDTGLLPEDMPMTIYADDGYHLRVRDGRVLLLWPDDSENTEPFDTSVSESWLEKVCQKTSSRIPSLKDVAIDREKCWAGLYEMSPDRHALLGRSMEIENFYLINGSSGHGVMHAPALGHLLAEIILDGRASTLDVHALRPSRFAEGVPITGAQLL